MGPGTPQASSASSSPSHWTVETGEKAQTSTVLLLLFQKPPLAADCQAFGFDEEGREGMTRQHGGGRGPGVWVQHRLGIC